MAKIDKFEKKIKNAIDISLKESAIQITNDIEKIYESAIENFYLDYSPKLYDRTESTYTASNQFGKPIKLKSYKNGYKVGIIVDSDNYSGNPYNTKDNSWVFNRTYEHGIHGFTRSEANEWNSRIKNRRKGIYFNYIKGMSKMNPSPEKYVNIELKKYKKNMNSIFINNLNKYL